MHSYLRCYRYLNQTWKIFFRYVVSIDMYPFTCKVSLFTALLIWKYEYLTDFLIFLAFIISILSLLPRGYKPCKVNVKIFSFLNQNSFFKLPNLVCSALNHERNRHFCQFSVETLSIHHRQWFDHNKLALFSEWFDEFCRFHLSLHQLVCVPSIRA